MDDSSVDLLRHKRLGKQPKDIADFSSSIDSDRRLVNAVIDINKAHCIMLVECNIIDDMTSKQILKALNALDPEMELDPMLEDAHMNVEARVIEKIGEDIGGRIHTAKSRNDQQNTALRIVTREDILLVAKNLVALIKTLLNFAKVHVDTLMPGYTHLQHAQPITLAHHFLSHVNALFRNVDRLIDAFPRVNVCPMGAAALATTTFPISRERISELLGFNKLMDNSIDAVASRDFLLEVLSIYSMVMLYLSQISEELILWSTSEFSYLELPDMFTSTSSIMPQKKNASVPELIRAKAATVFGDLMTSLSMIKALPLSYNLDLQELTKYLWHGFEITYSSVNMLTECIEGMSVNKNRMKEMCVNSFITATDLADFLVSHTQLPFRTTHRLVSNIVLALLEMGRKKLTDLDKNLFDKICLETINNKLDIDFNKLIQAIDPMESVKSRKIISGPSPDTVRSAIMNKEKELEKLMNKISSLIAFLEQVKEKLATFS
ncbi:argininosuccinate lyase [Candidatus Borrarchaeum sp.]|uniref:argininosuccinate lyase n=1 Tax=Candidatus Borrarchaeum sp. TaxID=2846742 RepID=UPI002579F3EA|nr:argininosuccinate lyase [Candidatus Borrarchaeum sp.]